MKKSLDISSNDFLFNKLSVKIKIILIRLDFPGQIKRELIPFPEKNNINGGYSFLQLTDTGI